MQSRREWLRSSLGIGGLLLAPSTLTAEEILKFNPRVLGKKIKLKDIDQTVKGIILSGGPLNVYQINKYSFDKKIINLNIPILGICFGHQILSKLNGGRVKQSKHREFGLANIFKKNESLLIKNFFT